MSLSPQLVLRTPAGRVHDYSEVVKMLKKSHGREPIGQAHRPDLRSVCVIQQEADALLIRFHEHVIGRNSLIKSRISTKAMCKRDAGNPSGITWLNFSEELLPTTTAM